MSNEIYKRCFEDQPNKVLWTVNSNYETLNITIGGFTIDYVTFGVFSPKNIRCLYEEIVNKLKNNNGDNRMKYFRFALSTLESAIVSIDETNNVSIELSLSINGRGIFFPLPISYKILPDIANEIEEMFQNEK